MAPPRRPALNAAQQALAISHAFPGTKIDLRCGRLRWEGVLQPSEMSRAYTVTISLGNDRIPRTRVISPELERRDGASIPHLYSDGSLCLYVVGEWRPIMLIARTIIPWTSEWLINYEIWRGTGDWHGGGEWPPRRAELKDAA